MNRLPPIPSPPSHYWDLFCQRALPLIVFSSVFCAAVVLWNTRIASSSMVGEVEMVRANITTTVPGMISGLTTDLLQRVQKDQQICMIVPMEADALKASLAAIAAELETERAQLAENQQRELINYQQLRLALMVKEVELAQDKVMVDYAISEYKRIEKLVQEKSESEFQLNYWRNQKETFNASVVEKSKLISTMKKSVDEMGVNVTPGYHAAALATTSKAIDAKQEELRQLQKPIILTAPFDGVVSAVFRRSGERVLAGDPIVTISALQATRIVAYVRQPISVRPKVGDPIEVRGRSIERPLGIAKVLSVGSQLEPIGISVLPRTVIGNPTIGRTTEGQSVGEYGLPLLISLPSNLNLLAGELVDLNPMLEKTENTAKKP